MTSSCKSTLESLLTVSVRAFDLGAKDIGKQRTQEDVSQSVRFSLRNGYWPMVWQAYKAGRFATKIGDI
ncbi:hypothetical protein QN372_18205 [Undibacterium sp. RTI2.1]|uniref:hypothetical protein n=1 Tax=unclassified Undibacterium TaxID=2630295 RepID=UPI002B222A20|nr:MULTISPECIES: hypothetical protein [unclassified Undibacterium]MEB0032685.1 hypothetical protein [Undibacterium sp. RTI2.1]MEB0118674.1 hypothetical protein [Undibacterium sp. RTI2.2]